MYLGLETTLKSQVPEEEAEEEGLFRRRRGRSESDFYLFRLRTQDHVTIPTQNPRPNGGRQTEYCQIQRTTKQLSRGHLGNESHYYFSCPTPCACLRRTAHASADRMESLLCSTLASDSCSRRRKCFSWYANSKRSHHDVSTGSSSASTACHVPAHHNTTPGHITPVRARIHTHARRHALGLASTRPRGEHTWARAMSAGMSAGHAHT